MVLRSIRDYKGGFLHLETGQKKGGAYSAAKFRLGDIEGFCLDLSKAGELGDYSVSEIIKENCN